MKSDLYTKAVLTIIALCLTWICVRDVVSTPTAQAAAPAQEVVITGVKIQLKDLSGNPVADVNGKPMYIWQLPVREFKQ